MNSMPTPLITNQPKERFFTIKIGLPVNTSSTTNGLTQKKLDMINLWFQEATEITNLHLDLIKETQRTDNGFHHSMLYNKIRKSCKNTPSSSLKHFKENAVKIALNEKKIVDENGHVTISPVFIDKNNFRFSLPKTDTSNFDFFIEIKNENFVVPCYSKETALKLRKIGLMADDAKAEKETAKELEIEGLLNEKKIHKNKYNSKGYRVIRGMFIRRHKKLFFYLTLAQKINPKKDYSSHIIGSRKVEIIDRFDKNVNNPMDLSAPPPPLKPSKTVFYAVEVKPRFRGKENPAPATILSIPKWANSDDVPIPHKRKERPGLKEELRVSGFRRWGTSPYSDGLGIVDEFLAPTPYREWLLDPQNSYENLRRYNAEHVAPKGLEPISLTKVLYVV